MQVQQLFLSSSVSSFALLGAIIVFRSSFSWRFCWLIGGFFWVSFFLGVSVLLHEIIGCNCKH
jgi:hypothetical protein